MGREYVIDHCVSRLNLEAEEELYKIYVTDSLRVLLRSKTRYFDLLTSMRQKPTDVIAEKEDAEKIISKMKKTLGNLGGQ